jgi:hypothetical protein
MAIKPCLAVVVGFAAALQQPEGLVIDKLVIWQRSSNPKAFSSYF